MTEALIVLAVALLASIWVLLLIERMHDEERTAWAEERDKLLERIQRPDRIPTAPRPDFVVPEREPDEWNKVGSIDIDEKWLNGEDG